MADAAERPETSCVFCAIVDRRAPAEVIGESERAIAFLTIGPLREGHALVIPKRHVVEFPDATDAELAEVASLGAQIARRQRAKLGSSGETLILASGEAGEQSVFHLHLHVVPRKQDDGIDLTGWLTGIGFKPDRQVLGITARRLAG